MSGDLFKPGHPGSTLTLDLSPEDREFPRFLENADEPKCQFIHKTTECSVEVTHAIKSCNVDALICQSAATYKLFEMHHHTCASCKKPADKCWKIRPV